MVHNGGHVADRFDLWGYCDFLFFVFLRKVISESSYHLWVKAFTEYFILKAQIWDFFLGKRNLTGFFFPSLHKRLCSYFIHLRWAHVSSHSGQLAFLTDHRKPNSNAELSLLFPATPQWCPAWHSTAHHWERSPLQGTPIWLEGRQR